MIDRDLTPYNADPGPADEEVFECIECPATITLKVQNSNLGRIISLKRPWIYSDYGETFCSTACARTYFDTFIRTVEGTSGQLIPLLEDQRS